MSLPTKSQCAMILAALKAGDRLTTKDARERFGCEHLQGRIHELRQRGHRIETDMIPLPNGKRVAEYRLP